MVTTDTRAFTYGNDWY